MSERAWKLTGPHRGQDGGTWWQIDAGRTLVHVASEEDARLIAAVPELLEALIQMREAAFGDEVALTDCTERANAAIAKAIGEQQ